jgi:geranylgeranyl diphosphate synthase type II
MKKGSSLASTPWPSNLTPLIEDALEKYLPSADTQPEPLHRAMRYAVFSGGKRVRPQLLLKVAQACGARGAAQELALRAACAVELVHIASLVHDDLPCFDSSLLRRGRPTVHVLFGEARALLVGDALLARSFGLVAAAPRSLAGRSVRIVELLSTATGSSSGLVAGQGLEQEITATPHAPEGAQSYHALKTGALFAMAAEAGAVASGARETAAWAQVGWLIGRGYQLAHDLGGLPASRPDGAMTPAGAPGALHGAAELLRAQLAALSAALHERISKLAAEPELLLRFLDEQSEPLLRRLAREPERAPKRQS